MVGNKKNYEDIDVLRVFLSVDKRVARQKISKELGIGEGSVKSILDLLCERQLIKPTNKGHSLIKRGEKIKEAIAAMISDIRAANFDIFSGMKGKAIHIKNPTEEITYKTRDIAIRNGADAALLFKFEGKLFLPQCEQDLIDTKNIDNLFDMSDGDYLVIVYSDDKSVIERALYNVAVGLNSGLGKVVEGLFG